ncbi:MAG: DUF3617 domain-containing protein [Hyphomicrobium sp.]|uniref:DUF3617 domain-containing protein n=1 Tax=Hyphomicrobium sp. TaxID=82 RepID=UPI0013213975|nr:DUF3617 family protein [Hyphomicrobium sp.]KAB2938950.1 MAG: DUF3617 family protein [Hyphomicrobium sp.]MBZ0208741.1 DUF3617 domain-containing protein [Hyphomicrobium sp.]
MPTRRIVSVVVLAASGCLFQAAAAELPKRKPGHWEITTVAPGTGMTTTHACVGPDDNIALPADSGDCSAPKVTPAGSEVIVDVVCKKAFGKQIMSTAFGGDFNARYHAVMKMTFDPPEGVPSMGVTIDGKYIGPDCPPQAQ